MESLRLSLLFSFFLLTALAQPRPEFRPTKLFVFGDSYADTGNGRKSDAYSWKVPYGITFPGKPAGRFSDGLIFTDYLAMSLGLDSPIPYESRNLGSAYLNHGMNFAYGGTGVFDTNVAEPNMTTQIDLFQQLIKDSVFTPSDIQSSMALVTLAGNDYSAFLVNNGSQGLQSFIGLVVNQLAMNLKRIRELGPRKVAVSTLQPLGCLPRNTIVSSFKQCDGTENALVGVHNLLLQQVVAKFNNETKDSAFVTLDLYESFMSILSNKASIGFENAFKPCCMGLSKEDNCGSVDEKGMKRYTVCEEPLSSFFWDMVHPTQEGWRALYSAMQSTLQQLY